MPAEKPSKLSELLDALREGTPGVKMYVGAWLEACRNEPRLIWHTPAIRIIVYIIAGILLVKSIGWGFTLLAPGGAEPAPRAETADFHVICTNPDCGKHFVTNRDFDFNDFPVKCPFCQKESGANARSCNSTTCKGRWVSPVADGERLTCPVCGGDLGPAP